MKKLSSALLLGLFLVGNSVFANEGATTGAIDPAASVGTTEGANTGATDPAAVTGTTEAAPAPDAAAGEGTQQAKKAKKSKKVKKTTTTTTTESNTQQ